VAGLGLVLDVARVVGRGLVVDLAQDLELGRALERARQDARVDEVALGDAAVALAVPVSLVLRWPPAHKPRCRKLKNCAMIGAAGREKLRETDSQRARQHRRRRTGQLDRAEVLQSQTSRRSAPTHVQLEYSATV